MITGCAKSQGNSTQDVNEENVFGKQVCWVIMVGNNERRQLLYVEVGNCYRLGWTTAIISQLPPLQPTPLSPTFFNNLLEIASSDARIMVGNNEQLRWETALWAGVSTCNYITTSPDLTTPSNHPPLPHIFCLSSDHPVKASWPNVPEFLCKAKATELSARARCPTRWSSSDENEGGRMLVAA